ncbi:MAG: hypothetical protein ACYCZF_12740 [Anaerolineae bacterium]
MMDLTRVNQITSWGFYLRVSNEAELDELLAVRPEYVCRGFMDWGQPNADYYKLRWIVDRAHAADIRFEGGISFSPVRPRPGEMSQEVFDQITTTNAAGLYTGPADNAAYRQGAIHNPYTRAWFLGMAWPQIDVGVDGIHVDEIECHYPWRGLGFDRYALDAFRDWLIARYTAGGWRLDDKRWQSEMGVDLSLYGGSMAGFEFIRHLQAKGLYEDAISHTVNMGSDFRFQKEDAVGALWGDPWYERWVGTFQFDTVERYWGEAVSLMKQYAARNGRQLIVNENMNATARPFCDYTMAHSGLSYHNARGEFDLSRSCAKRISEVKAASKRRAGDIPVVFFLDWGHNGSDMDSIPVAKRNGYIRKVAAEASAQGTFFSLPINGEGYNALQMGYLETCVNLANFYRREKRLFLPGQAWPMPPIPSPALTANGITHPEGYDVIHCVNHLPGADGTLATQRDARVILPAGPQRGIKAYSFEWSGGRHVDQVPQEDGSNMVILPAFETYCALELR